MDFLQNYTSEIIFIAILLFALASPQGILTTFVSIVITAVLSRMVYIRREMQSLADEKRKYQQVSDAKSVAEFEALKEIQKLYISTSAENEANKKMILEFGEHLKREGTAAIEKFKRQEIQRKYLEQQVEDQRKAQELAVLAWNGERRERVEELEALKDRVEQQELAVQEERRRHANHIEDLERTIRNLQHSTRRRGGLDVVDSATTAWIEELTDTDSPQLQPVDATPIVEEPHTTPLTELD